MTTTHQQHSCVSVLYITYQLQTMYATLNKIKASQTGAVTTIDVGKP